MITRDNIKEVLLTLDPKDIDHALQSDGDRVAVYSSGYGDPFIIAWDDLENEEDVLSTGGFICDKDTLYQLYKEQGLSLDEILNNIID